MRLFLDHQLSSFHKVEDASNFWIFCVIAFLRDCLLCWFIVGLVCFQNPKFKTKLISGDSKKGFIWPFYYHLGFQGRKKFYYEMQGQSPVSKQGFVIFGHC